MNVKFVNKHNAEAAMGKHTYTVEVNKFADLTSEEFRAMYNRFNATSMKPLAGSVYQKSGLSAPDSVDWRDQGYVTPVKNQAQCGSCWAFSTVASLEGQHFKASGKLVSLSEQNLVDCSTKEGNQGCNGGLMDQAFTYIKNNGGIDTEESYPYEGRDGQCRFNKNNVGATVSGFVDIKSGSEEGN